MTGGLSFFAFSFHQYNWFVCIVVLLLIFFVEYMNFILFFYIILCLQYETAYAETKQQQQILNSWSFSCETEKRINSIALINSILLVLHVSFFCLLLLLCFCSSWFSNESNERSLLFIFSVVFYMKLRVFHFNEIL